MKGIRGSICQDVAALQILHPKLLSTHVVLRLPVFNSPDFVDYKNKMELVLQPPACARIENIPEPVADSLVSIEHLQVVHQKELLIVSANLTDNSHEIQEMRAEMRAEMREIQEMRAEVGAMNDAMKEQQTQIKELKAILSKVVGGAGATGGANGHNMPHPPNHQPSTPTPPPPSLTPHASSGALPTPQPWKLARGVKVITMI